MSAKPVDRVVLADLPRPDVARAEVVVRAPGEGPGYWVGAPSAVAGDDGAFWLAYRVRRPLGEGRGVAVSLARWTPGRGAGRLEQVAAVRRESFGAESLERPALVRRPDGGWRLYVSCATPGSKHWWVDALDAGTVAGLPTGTRTTVWPGDDRTAVKDPVVHAGPDGWRAWVCCHPLDVAGAEDRMWSAETTSPDGLAWATPVPVLRPGDGGWDARGTRITAVGATATGEVAWYDGRADAASNWFEQTGVAVREGTTGPFAPVSGGAPVAASPAGTRALRYLCVVPDPSGGTRLFFEASRDDGAHDLLTQLVPRERSAKDPRPAPESQSP